MCLSTLGSFDVFGNKVKTHGKSTSRNLVAWVFSQNHFSLDLEKIIEDNMWGRGPGPVGLGTRPGTRASGPGTRANGTNIINIYIYRERERYNIYKYVHMRYHIQYQ